MMGGYSVGLYHGDKRMVFNAGEILGKPFKEGVNPVGAFGREGGWTVGKGIQGVIACPPGCQENDRGSQTMTAKNVD